MGRQLNQLFRFTTWVVTLAAVGCGGPIVLKQADFDPEAAGSKAIEIYDKNGDGAIAGEEIDQAPSIKDALARLDVSGDGQVSAEEITRLVESWKNDGSVITRLKCFIILDGEPVEGATITLEPEAFLGGVIATGTGLTDRLGRAAISIPPEKRQDATLTGVNVGMYLVRISKVEGGQETIPARYNTQTTLGLEVALRARYKPGAARFVLTSD